MKNTLSEGDKVGYSTEIGQVGKGLPLDFAERHSYQLISSNYGRATWNSEPKPTPIWVLYEIILQIIIIIIIIIIKKNEEIVHITN